MEQCDYCEEAFEAEEEYLDHLYLEHDEDELSRIDRQRVDNLGPGTPSRKALFAVVAVLGFVLASTAYVTFIATDGASGFQGPEAGLPDDPDQSLLEDVETFEVQDVREVESGTEIEYGHVPPTTGPHYSGWTPPDFYEERQPMGELVNNLKHGHVVVYYDPGQITPPDRQSLQNLTEAYDDSWASVVVAPHPEDDPDAAITMTAWTKRLALNEYDLDTVKAFLAEYMGRSPENPVRGQPLSNSS